MATYGYIRTSRDQDPGHPGSAPEVQRHQLADAGVDHARIYADIDVFGVAGGCLSSLLLRLSERGLRQSMNGSKGSPAMGSPGF